MCIYIYIYIIYMVFTTEGFLEVAIESWPQCDLNPRPLIICIYIYIHINQDYYKNHTL